MGSGKRASMREGPLANLFRKTETEGLEPPRAEEPPERATPTPQERLRHAFSSEIPGDMHGPARRGAASRARRLPVVRGARRSRRRAAAAGRRRRRRRRERRQPHDRGRGLGRRVHRAQHRRAVAAAVVRARDAADRRRHHARARLGLRSRPRPPGGDGGLRPDQVAAQGLGHGVHHRGRGRRHRHRRGAGRRARGARARRAGRRHRHQAVRLRGHAPAAGGRGGDRGARPTRSTR